VEAAGGHGAVVGALATVPEVVEAPLPVEAPPGIDPIGAIVPTGFAALDEILGPGGVPRQASLAVRGDHSSGKTTLALRLVAEAQATGSIVAWLDLARSLDPVEAVARGVRLEWLVVLAPETLDEGLAMAGALLQGRAVDLLVADLPAARGAGTASRAGGHSPSAADRLHRLAALARRAGALLVLLEPPELSRPVAGALAEAAGLRLELVRRSWIRLGRDVVGQRTEVVVARNRFGPPGRRAELRILYAEGGERDGCLARESLLLELPAPPGRPAATASESTVILPLAESHTHATPPSPLATPPPPARPVAFRVVSAEPRPGTDRPGRAALDARRRPRREPGRPGTGHPPRDGARQRTSAGA
jgi:RecA/RadA recombinase